MTHSGTTDKIVSIVDRENLLPMRTDTPLSGSGKLPAVSGRGTRLADALRHASHGMLLCLALTVPLSTSIAELSVSLAFLFWFLAGGWRDAGSLIRRHPVVLASLGMFGLLALGIIWTSATSNEALRALGKYREFLYAPVMIAILSHDIPMRRLCRLAFMAGMTMMVGLSYSEFLFGLEIGHLSATDYVIFKDRIAHGLLLAVYIYLLAWEVTATRGWARVACCVLGTLSLGNALVLIQGRTGYLVLSCLILTFALLRFGRMGLVYGTAANVALWSAILVTSPVVQSRVHYTVSQLQTAGDEAPRRASEDHRPRYYEYSLRAFFAQPLMGTGTGSFANAYRDVTQGVHAPVTDDPHSEYLILGVQLGAPGPLAFLGLLVTQWFAARHIPKYDRAIIAGLLVAIGVGSAFNSLMYGFTGGLVWALFTGISFSGYSVTAAALPGATDVSSSAPARAA